MMLMFHRYWIKVVLAITLSHVLSSCGVDTEIEQNFHIVMFGVLTSPQGVTGDEDPIWQKYTLQSVSFTSDDGNEETSLYSGENATVKRIVDRPQIIYEKDIALLNGKSFSKATVTFDSSVVGAFGDKENYQIVLTNPTLTLNKTFTVEDGKGLDLEIKVNWKNTVNDSTMSEPSFELDVSTN